MACPKPSGCPKSPNGNHKCSRSSAGHSGMHFCEWCDDTF